MRPFQQPMQPFPSMAAFARKIFLPRNNLNIFLYAGGKVDSSWVVLVHGLGDESDTWRYVFPALIERYHVLALDLPGFGRSDKPNLSYTMHYFQDVLLEVMQNEKISSAVLVGHSLGALIVHSFALNHPDMVDDLVLIDGCLTSRAQKLDLKTVGYIIPGLGEWMYDRLRKDPQAAFESLRPYYSNLDGLPENERAFLYQRVNERVWSDGQRDAFLSTLRNLARWLPAQQRGLPERLGKLAVPTLAIWGEQDALQNPDNGRYLEQIQPSARLKMVAGAGHNLQQEQPGSIIEAILADSNN